MGWERTDKVCPGCGKALGYISTYEHDTFVDSAGRFWHDTCASVALSGLFVAPPPAREAELPLVWQEV